LILTEQHKESWIEDIPQAALLVNVMLSMKDVHQQFSVDPPDDDQLDGPSECWGRIKKLTSSESLYDQLNKAIQKYSVDNYRNDPAFLRLWLAYLESH